MKQSEHFLGYLGQCVKFNVKALRLCFSIKIVDFLRMEGVERKLTYEELEQKAKNLRRALDLATVFISQLVGYFKNRKFNKHQVIQEVDEAEECLLSIREALKGREYDPNSVLDPSDPDFDKP